MEGKNRDHRQLAKADGTRAGGGASISHSLTPVHIALVRRSMWVWHGYHNVILLLGSNVNSFDFAGYVRDQNEAR